MGKERVELRPSTNRSDASDPLRKLAFERGVAEGGPLLPRLVRGRIRGAVHRGPLAVPALRPLREHGSRHLLAVNLLGAISQLVSARIAARIGHVRTMVSTHLPANVFLLLAGLMPTLPLAALFLLLRAMLSQMASLPGKPT